MSRSYLVALFFNNLIFHMMTVTCGWVAFTLTGDPLSLAMVGFMQFLPAIILFIFSGVAADTYDKRNIVALTSLAMVLLSSFLCSAVTEGDSSDANLIYVVLFVYSCCRSLEATAMASMVLEVTGEKNLSRTVALGSTVKQIAKVTGPILAGYLLVLDETGAFAFAAISIAAFLSGISILGTVFISPLSKNPAELEERGHLGVFSGLQTIRRSPILLGALSLDLIAGLFGGLLGLLPLVVSEVLEGDAATLGWLRSTVALGALLMSVSLATFSINRRLGANLLLSVLALGILMGLASFTTNPMLFGVLLFLFGFVDALSVHIRHNLIQLAAPSTNRGRVTAASQLFVVVSNQLSEVRAGLMVSATGVVATVLIGGVAVTACALSWSRFFPALARLNSFEDFLPTPLLKKSDCYSTSPTLIV